MGSIFRAWQRSGAHALTDTPDGARRTGKVAVRLTPMTGSPFQTASLAFGVFSPGDVAGLRNGAIRHRHPAPGVESLGGTDALAIV